MTRAYYNEIDGFCCDWLSNLMDARLITPGEIDNRSIVDVTPDDVTGFHRVHFFAGIAGWDLALNLAGWGEQECWTGSCPCQPLSSAGQQKGHADERHLWPAFYSLITERTPPVVFGEQVASTIGREWFSGVRADLEACGYACGTAIIPACGIGAPHRRDRQWFVAHAERDQQPRKEPCRRPVGRMGRQQQPFPWDDPWPRALASLRALDDGISRSVEATDAARNAIVPQVGAAFIGAYLDVMSGRDTVTPRDTGGGDG